MRSIRTLIGVAALAVGSLAFGGTASAAIPGAAPPDGTPAVPYVAWVGEHVQIAACPPAGKNMGTGSTVVYQLEDWSGIAAREPFPILSPQVSNFSDKAAKGGVLKRTIGSNPTPSRNCAVQEWSALKPGIARFKVYQSTQTGDSGSDGVSPTSSNPVIVRVIWLEFDGASLTHADGTTASKSVMAGNTDSIWHNRSTSDITEALANRGDTATVGDPYYAPDKSTYYDPGLNRYQVKVTVKGTFPLGENYARWHSVYGLFGSDGLVHLPAQWSDLGRALANDLGADDANGFDIHDDNVNQPTDLHYVGGLCPGLTALTTSSNTDQVDTCFGNVIDLNANVPDGFSRVWSSGTYGGALGGLTTGPFNPLDADASWLPDGKVDAGDAPMPAARVDFAITQNTGGATDTTGVGFLTDVRKQDVYVRRDPATHDLLPHAWYAPFYVQNIPASRDYGVPGSGVSGTQVKDVSTPVNVSNGWLPFPPAAPGTAEYENWARGAGWLRRTDLRGNTQCVLDGLSGSQRSELKLIANFRPKPYGEARMAVYTDEHGEAYAAFVPGVGAYFDAFGVKNSNGGCDLQDDNGHPFDLGTAEIKATAFYPYQQGEGYGPAISNPVAFRVTSKFTKLLNYYPKGPSKQDGNVRIVVAHAQDVDGSPLSGELVCFMADKNAEGMSPYRNPLGIAIKGGATWLSPAEDLVVQSRTEQDESGLGRICGRTDKNGNIAVEVMNSNGTQVDVMADFVDEGLFRDRFVDFSKPGTSATDIAGGSSAPTAAQVGRISAINSTGAIAATKAQVVKRAKKAVRTARIASASVKAGHLVVRVNGTAKAVRIRIAITNSKGKTRVVIRTIAVNKNVTVKKVRITKKTGRVSVAVLAG